MLNRSIVISIIGRPNVGKSSLFNKLMKRENRALTHNEPGVTRDRHYGIGTFDDLGNEDAGDAIIIDTGGFYPTKVEETKDNASKFFNIMREHAKMAILESDLVLFVVDVREGILPFDKDIAKYIRSEKKKMWLVVNKFDTDKQIGDEAEFYALGVDKMHIVSTAHNRGVTDLRENIQREINLFEGGRNFIEAGLQQGVAPREEVISRLALIGAPNAGKSTLLNLLVGAERALVSDIAGTTVDPIEGFFDLYFGKDALDFDKRDQHIKNDGLLFVEYDKFRQNNPDVFNALMEQYDAEEEEGRVILSDISESALIKTNTQLKEDIFEADTSEASEIEDEEDKGAYWKSLHIVDTAGIRKQRSIEGFIESQSVFRSLRCITESDIVVYLVDATKGITHQDRRLIDIAFEKGKSVIVLLNKIDLLKDILKNEKDKKEWIENIRIDIPWLDHVDVIPISSKYAKGIKSLKKSLKKTIKVRHSNIPTGELNRFMYNLIDRHPVILKNSGGSRLKVKYTSMIKSCPPTFLMFTNKSRGIPENYRRYLKNNLRFEFHLDNTPIHLIFRTGHDLENRAKEEPTS